MKAKARTLFLLLTLAAGFYLLTELLSVGVAEIAYATPSRGEDCALCHQSKQMKESKDTKGFTVDFMTEECSGFSSTGTNPFFILEPGYRLVLEGSGKSAGVRLTITVLDETKIVNGVKTRVVEERETLNDVLVEVSKNYFAICNRNNSVFYFGEDVDIFTGGAVSHEGSWLAGVNGAKAGIIMPGVILLGAKYFQEIAPQELAMDRSEIKSMTEVVETPAGTFENCLKTFETSPLDRKAKDLKFYARGIGLVKDGDLELEQYGQLP